MENLKMKYNTIVITGSNGSTAKGLINYFSNISHNVIGVTRTVRQEYEQSNISILTADMEKLTEVEAVASEIKNKFPSIDIWINCVGGFAMGSSIQDDNENWEKMYSMNFLTCLNGSRVALKYMVDQEDGHLINIGSEAALDGFPGAAAYLVSKSSVHMLTRLISLENKENNITSNAILPGIIDTSANRNAMPNEDYSTWQTPKQIAQMIERTIDEKCNGMLVRITD
ncbi:MAG: hypothetical protein CMG76_00655 [Candidatus Marinimicrobia bacterium]|nr:hypothetical protein [Candidatus Neomarinimicrobiota bacterium]